MRRTMEPLNLSELAADVCQELAWLKEKEIVLTYEGEPKVMVRGNRGLLTRLLRNLIHYAYLYGREKGHIWVFLGRKDGGVELSVADDGNQATELGPSMVQEIAWLHGGEVKVANEPGKGRIFTVVL